MVNFDSFVPGEGIPIYLQILTFIKRGIIAGSIQNGDELPSRRVLSALLGVNPNTVQKAYRILEEDGLIQSRSGAKSYMMFDEEKYRTVREEVLEADARSIAAALREMGLSKEEALHLITRYWQEDETL